MAGRVPYEGFQSEYPPFLPPSIEVDPTDPDSSVFVNPESPPLGETNENTFLTPAEIILGPKIPPIPEIPPEKLPPPPGTDPADKPSVIGDVPFTGGQQGDIAIRGPEGWIMLGADTKGKVLTTNGKGANPSWEVA